MRRAEWLALGLLLTACTAVHYESPRLAERIAESDTVAVLPFEILITGRLPEGFDAEQIRRIEEAESVAFQHAFYNRLLDRSSATRRRPIRVAIQPADETLRRLAERGMGPRESWSERSGSLTALLDVDAVIRTRVVEERYLSDFASYGAEVGLEVLHQVTEGSAEWLIPPGLTRTHDIHVESSLLQGNGEMLWKVEVHRATDWRRPASDVIVGLTRKLAKKFPYRG